MEINININASDKVVDALVSMANAIDKLSMCQLVEGIEKETTVIKEEKVKETVVEEPKSIEITTVTAPHMPTPVTNTVPVAEKVEQVELINSTPIAPQVPVTEVTYDLQQLAVSATQLVDAGRRTELLTLLNKFGVQALTQLPKEQYGAFATELRGMGANI